MKFATSFHFIFGILLGIASFVTFAITGHIIAGISFGVPFILFGFLKVSGSPRTNSICTYIWLFLACVLSTQVSQSFADTHIGLVITTNWKNFVAEVLMLSALPLLLFAITLKPRLSFAVGIIPLLLLSLANYYLYTFRGSELNPMDLNAMGTATQVAGNYNFGWGFNPICGLFSYLMILHIGFCFKQLTVEDKAPTRAIAALLCAVAIAVPIAMLPSVYIMAWDKMGSTGNGFLMNFFAQVRQALKQTPEGYTYKLIDEIADRYKQTSSEPALITDSASKDYPTIIAIMDEAYTDLSILNPGFGDTLFYRTLDSNVIKGHALSSVYGGGTSNSEYEFLTGNSMAFVTQGASVYQQYIKVPAFSMASYLKSLGYETMATHPFHKQGWSRFLAWPLLGFDNISFMEDYPQKNLIRGYVSDQEMYEYVVQKFEHKKKPLFLFGVTMQNHSSYTEENHGRPISVHLDKYPGFPDAELYTGLIRESDKALRYLINYFRQVNEKVIIVFYGDHFPGLNMKFYQKLYGKDFATLQDRQKLYTIPFFIWANYKIESKDISLTSFNYLSNYVYKAAGIELPAHNRFLEDLEKDIPAMNYWGFYSTSQKRFLDYKYAEGKEKELLSDYRMMQYNSIFDRKNRNSYFFPAK